VKAGDAGNVENHLWRRHNQEIISCMMPDLNNTGYVIENDAGVLQEERIWKKEKENSAGKDG